MDLSIDPGDAGIVRYSEEFNGIVEDYDLQGMIGTVLKAQISRRIDLESQECKSDNVALFDMILEQVKARQRFHRMSQDYAARGDSKLERKPQRADTSKVGPTLPTTPAALSPLAPSRPPQLPRASQAARSPPHDGGLVCNGPHWLRDCSVATAQQHDEARRKFREAKEQRSSTLRSRVTRYVTPTGSVRINVFRGGLHAGHWADKSVVPEGIVKSLFAVQPTLLAISLSTAVGAEMADGRRVLCDMELRLDLELSTIAGSVSMRLVPCLILPSEGDDFLLGRDALKTLGIDIEDQLSQLASQPILAAEEEEFPVSDNIPDGQHTPSANCDVERLVVRAVANGMPAEYVDAVREILAQNPDAWREPIGSDPPARVDDAILFVPTVHEFVGVLRQFFSLVAKALLKLNMAKCSLYTTEVKWCGRLISGSGIRHDPDRVDALSTLPVPATVAELKYFVCATNWLQNSLPDFARYGCPLQAKLVAEKKHVGGRSRNALNAATLWTAEEQNAYSAMLALVRDSAVMTSPSPDAELLVFVDVSTSGYSIVVTQVVDWNPFLPVAQQKHEMVICKGGTFKHNELN
ncbi:unnamed protein product [Phytophthora fragariaefolia]|uniref:Unnamed protein product n=1 Tax=Phytophthora fragariaefolia TaxID=1490495 RepID=A0A9W7CXA1_9STRA|nr:unnamed protein product [Phytophthora fragariaefolia]